MPKQILGATCSDMALKVLDPLHDSGFWTATKQEDGTWKMISIMR
jgi:hypothetical protein